MTTVHGARQRARTEITTAIKEEARRQLAAGGAAKLSLRSVARELGMVSSALYRYFPSRDDLLTALIIDAFDAVGAAAEAAAASDPSDPSDPAGPLREGGPRRPEPTAPHGRQVARWVAVAAAVRAWAVAHPHEYALIYGSPVPGYTAPMDTVGPAARVGMVLIGIARDAHRTEGLALPPLPEPLKGEARRIAEDIAPELPPAVAAALVAAWAQLFGLISFEVFGQFNRLVEDGEVFFRHTARRIAAEVGLRGEPAARS
ncbi:TetR/AcrR family transcriptional regulator [Streptomyces sp. NPDC005805]|uniref:TetR/AcrR family transcriptional regulator n=1 Tax=Streptomyces sp. NPDC005805 TaxID=3157068 RepID=UPI0033DD4C7D